LVVKRAFEMAVSWVDGKVLSSEEIEVEE